MRYPVFRPRHVGSATPGAVVESHQLQFSKNPGPSGPEEIAESHSDFARRKFFSGSRGNPRKWGPGPTPPVRGRWPEGPEGVGWATMSTKCSSGAVSGGVLVTLPPWAKSLAARRRRNTPRTTNAIRNLPPHPSRLRRATFPYPLCRFATSPLDKGSRPPRGRFLGGFGPLTKKGSRKAGQRRGGEIPRTLYLLWLKPPQSGFNKEGSTHETNPMRKRRNRQT